MSKVQIIGAPQSTFVRVVRIAAEEKGVAYDLIATPPQTPDVFAIHPLGKIPVMRHGDIELFESKAIATYFDRAFAGPRLIPEDALGAARVEQWVSLQNSGFQHAAFGPYIAGYIFPGTADGAPDRARIEAVLAKVEHALIVLDHAVSATGFLVGPSFTLADIAMIPTLHYLRNLPESAGFIADLPVLEAYLERCEARASVKATIPPPLSAQDIATVTQLRAAGAA
jgi:glutathione S-transferase